jgi:hypothetical protein
MAKKSAHDVAKKLLLNGAERKTHARIVRSLRAHNALLIETDIKAQPTLPAGERITRGISRVLGIDPPDEDFLIDDNGPLTIPDREVSLNQTRLRYTLRHQRRVRDC